MLELLGLGIGAAAAAGGYINARRFVRTRLRFVDGVQRRVAPWLAGALAALVAAPLTALIPLIGGGTALVFGVAVGVGVARGAKDVRQLSGEVFRA
ncbi:MAG: hypothetical protein ACREON_01675 [Gemmatimonadaceae bacterium]